MHEYFFFKPFRRGTHAGLAKISAVPQRL
jgi:hypothetical protein